MERAFSQDEVQAALDVVMESDDSEQEESDTEETDSAEEEGEYLPELRCHRSKPGKK